jgi:hypothetical protein
MQLMDLKYIFYCYYSKHTIFERCHTKIKEKIFLFLLPDISTLYVIRYWRLSESCNKMLGLKIVFKQFKTAFGFPLFLEDEN